MFCYFWDVVRGESEEGETSSLNGQICFPKLHLFIFFGFFCIKTCNFIKFLELYNIYYFSSFPSMGFKNNFLFSSSMVKCVTCYIERPIFHTTRNFCNSLHSEPALAARSALDSVNWRFVQINRSTVTVIAELLATVASLCCNRETNFVGVSDRIINQKSDDPTIVSGVCCHFSSPVPCIKLLLWKTYLCKHFIMLQLVYKICQNSL